MGMRPHWNDPDLVEPGSPFSTLSVVLVAGGSVSFRRELLSSLATSADMDAISRQSQHQQLPDSQYSLGASTLARRCLLRTPVLDNGREDTSRSRRCFHFRISRHYHGHSLGRSDYNALDVKVKSAFSKGVMILAAYTWSSNWDNIWGAYGCQILSTRANNGPQEHLQPSLRICTPTNDIPNRFTVAGSWELPVGRAKPCLDMRTGLVDELLVAGDSTTS